MADLPSTAFEKPCCALSGKATLKFAPKNDIGRGAFALGCCLPVRLAQTGPHLIIRKLARPNDAPGNTRDVVTESSLRSRRGAAHDCGNNQQQNPHFYVASMRDGCTITHSRGIL
jgi:hypothetical protein